jgi:NAD+ synthase (glutamine-hydrolysing)
MTTLKSALNELRIKRNFNVDTYLKEKIEVINKFFTDEGLDSAVVGLSGGVDSAVVYNLLLAAANEQGSPIKLVQGVFIPIEATGITGQRAAEKNVNLLVKTYTDKGVYSVVDGTLAAALLVKQFPSDISPWAQGQMACIIRTPILYGQAAYLQTTGLKSLVVGTTNRDEGSYIGFFGKASDAMVDLQPIADLHKSEVYALANKLKVPQEIINATPKGDVWDERVDEEMIGAPYWFLEMYLLMKQYYSIKEQNDFPHSLSKEEKDEYWKYAVAIELIHSNNKHKYKVGSPARFIDVMERAIEGGWKK